MNVVIKETDIIKAANEGMDEFVNLFSNAILDSIGGSLTAENMAELSADQITLLAYKSKSRTNAVRLHGFKRRHDFNNG